mmetsp:Transcript_110505/g.323264  ORF Transcript_110505/g.323264 Transcript_110505/m.323264 type:complete len:850 (-) Transcript_110505:212-2761(-)
MREKAVDADDALKQHAARLEAIRSGLASLGKERPRARPAAAAYVASDRAKMTLDAGSGTLATSTTPSDDASQSCGTKITAGTGIDPLLGKHEAECNLATTAALQIQDFDDEQAWSERFARLEAIQHNMAAVPHRPSCTDASTALARPVPTVKRKGAWLSHQDKFQSSDSCQTNNDDSPCTTSPGATDVNSDLLPSSSDLGESSFSTSCGSNSPASLASEVTRSNQVPAFSRQLCHQGAGPTNIAKPPSLRVDLSGSLMVRSLGQTPRSARVQGIPARNVHGEGLGEGLGCSSADKDVRHSQGSSGAARTAPCSRGQIVEMHSLQSPTSQGFGCDQEASSSGIRQGAECSDETSRAESTARASAPSARQKRTPHSLPQRQRGPAGKACGVSLSRPPELAVAAVRPASGPRSDRSSITRSPAASSKTAWGSPPIPQCQQRTSRTPAKALETDEGPRSSHCQPQLSNRHAPLRSPSTRAPHGGAHSSRSSSQPIRMAQTSAGAAAKEGHDGQMAAVADPLPSPSNPALTMEACSLCTNDRDAVVDYPHSSAGDSSWSAQGQRARSASNGSDDARGVCHDGTPPHMAGALASNVAQVVDLPQELLLCHPESTASPQLVPSQKSVAMSSSLCRGSTGTGPCQNSTTQQASIQPAAGLAATSLSRAASLPLSLSPSEVPAASLPPAFLRPARPCTRQTRIRELLSHIESMPCPMDLARVEARQRRAAERHVRQQSTSEGTGSGQSQAVAFRRSRSLMDLVADPAGSSVPASKTGPVPPRLVDELLRRLPRTCATGDDAEPCTICLEVPEPGVNITMLPCCHRYHQDCIREWLVHSRLCPLCKASAIPADLDLPGL